MPDILVRPLIFSALAALFFTPLERVLPREHAHHRADFVGDLAFATAGQVVAHTVLAVVLGAVLSWLPLAPPLFASVAPTSLRKLLDVATGLLLFELTGYAYHRLAHRLSWLRRLHAVHHSSESLDWLAGFRQHPLEIVIVTLLQNAPLVLLGIPLAAHTGVLLWLKLHTLFVHANLDIPAGWWSRWLATPRFHHRHHAREGREANFATLLPVLDMIFGTYAGDRSAAFGLKSPTSSSFLALLALPFRKRRASRLEQT